MNQDRPYGYHGRLLHVDLSTGEHWIETPDEKWYRQYAGGGLMGTALLLKWSEAGIDPLGEGNLLILASSIIAGQKAPGLSRFSVICKSPLTGGIAESRCEGSFASALKASGYDAIIIHGQSKSPSYLSLEGGTPTICEADELWGSDTHETTVKLRQLFGTRKTRSLAIGKAGENLVRYASIVTDESLQVMRMGCGAVMGSKHLKAIVLSGGELPEVKTPQVLEELTKEFTTRMEENSLSMWQKDPPGFSASADLSDLETAYIGEDNYRSNLNVANSDFARDSYLTYYRHAIPCPGCPNDCIKVIGPEGIPDELCTITQEVTGSLGPNIGNRDLALMLKANAACNRLGLDPVSLGFTISFALECQEEGLLNPESFAPFPIRFGSCENLLELIEAIADREGIGDLLAEGSKRAAEQIGDGAQRFALHVKGLEMVSFEPRTQTNLALGYATAPIGPRYDICEHDWDFDTVSGWDHTLTLSRTLGITERIEMEYLGKKKVRNFKALYSLWSGFDALNFCIFAGAPTRVISMDSLSAMIEAITGWKTSSYELMRWGERRNLLMRIYNHREGITSSDDTLPSRFFTEPISYGRLKGAVLDETGFKEVIHCYYESCGLDQRGLPTEATLYDHGLEWALELIR